MSEHDRDSNPAEIVLVCGASYTGKTAWVKRRIRKAPRALVWDVKNEYWREGSQFFPIYSASDLLRAIRHRRGRFAFVPPQVDQKWFNFFCKAAFSWYGAVVIVDELADVTTASKAPTWWGVILRRGRDQGLKVYGITNRPAESDKTILGNVTLTHCCRMKRRDDRAYMADEMGCDRALLDGLKPFDYVECDNFGRITRGHLAKK